MTRSLLESMRPTPQRPDAAWAARTLESILRPATGPELGSSSTDAELTTRVSRPDRSRAGARRPPAGLAAAAALAVLGATGLSVHLGLTGPNNTVLANPADSPRDSRQTVATTTGPLSASELHDLVQSCSPPGEAFTTAAVHYAATTSDGTDQAPRRTAVVEDRRGEYHLCVSPPVARGVPDTEQSAYGPGVLGPGGDLSPTSERPMSLITTSRSHSERKGDRLTDVHLAVALAVTAKIARVEARLSGAGADGRWFSGAVHGGFVYIPMAVPQLDAPDGTPHVTVELNGYDTAGQLVASDQQPYLNGNRDSHGEESAFWR